MNEPTPKTMPCKICGTKPKREIISWSYGDSDDELFLSHRCKAGSMRFPEKDTFSSTRFEFQELLVVKPWNEMQTIQESLKK